MIATGGAIIRRDGWVIHQFTESGVFTVSRSIKVEYLIVGGGGGGGARNASAGGGGGGGVQTGIKTVVAGANPVIVGDGGIGGLTSPTTRDGMVGKNGGDSVCFGVVAIGGGGGGTTISSNTASAAGADGGSGGGGGVTHTGHAGSPGGIGVAGQGYHGGQALRTGSGYRGGGGGGGAGGPGMDATAAVRAAGGPGFMSMISGEAVVYAIGGRGGALGDNDMQPGLVNSGNGGDGASSEDGVFLTGAQGGSGIVIIRYRDRRYDPFRSHAFHSHRIGGVA